MKDSKLLINETFQEILFNSPKNKDTIADTIWWASKKNDVNSIRDVIGPGGKGSNQAVAAAKSGAQVSFISRIGNDDYGKMAKKMYYNLLNINK